MEEKEENAHNFFVSIRPVAYFLKVFGMFPMTLKKSKIVSTLIDVLITVASLGIYTFLVASNLTKTNTFIVSNTSSIALASIWKISYIITMISQVCMIVHQFCKIKEISTLINQIQNVDQMVYYFN